MNETELYILDSIKQWVWSGYYLAEHVHDMLQDILEDGVDEDSMHQAIDAEFEKKAQAENTWEPVTDCDRLDGAFGKLDKMGICACQNAGYTMSDGYTEIAEALASRGKENYQGYCFFHEQDVERALQGHGLTIAFGDLNDNPDKTIAVGQTVKRVLEEAGFDIAWDGTAKTRLNIPTISWQRRY